MASPAPKRAQEIQEIKLGIVGGNKFGRYNKTSDEQTWNMIVSDNSLVDYAGYAAVITQSPASFGRGIYTSVNGNIMIVILGNTVYYVDSAISIHPVIGGTLQTSTGDVFISENNNHEIVITDNQFMYVYNYDTLTFLTSTLGTAVPGSTFNVKFKHPGYVSFQDGRIIVADVGSNNWWLSGINAATQWNVSLTTNKAYTGTLQTKPDHIQAAVPLPGGGSNIIIFGHTVMEQWQDVGNAVFPYQKSTTSSVDFGCLNPSSIAALDTYIVWLGANEQGGATLMVYQGGIAKSISTDGMDFKLANLTNPSNCTGFLFRQDGHLIYQFTFPDDNLSYIYDFETKQFFTVSDEKQNYHIARNVVFFQNDYYFVSLNGGNVYRFGTQYSNFQYSSENIQMMPRIRICPPIRLPSQRMFISKSLGFTVENGQPNIKTTLSTSTYGVGDLLDTESGIEILTEGGSNLALEANDVNTTKVIYSEAIDLSLSRDGAASFGNSWRQYMNPTGNRRSRLIWQRLGQANDLTAKLQFIGYGRFVCVDDGVVEAYQ
jgi:hypothetical protein